MRYYLFFLLVFVQSITAQAPWSQLEVLEFQNNMNTSFRDSIKSPLKEKDRRHFEGLDFFEINPKYAVIANFVRTKKEKPFEMPTTTSRKPLYVKYGELHFNIDGVACVLNVYQNLDLIKNPRYKDYLFLPFTDRTSGAETYGGGRYLDMKIPKDKKVLLDFNLAYNPYCVYNEKYSCPIPPAANDLNVEIYAGVKNFQKSE
jgi:uncharacterized protein (DUF1684 family)